MALGKPVAQQVRDTQKRLRRDLRSGVVSDVINAQQSLRTRLGLEDQPEEVVVPTRPTRVRRGAVRLRNGTLVNSRSGDPFEE